MTRDFLIGARPLHERGMLKLGLRQLAESEVRLRKLLEAYERSGAPHLQQEIADECVFISETLGSLEDMVRSTECSDSLIVSGALLRASRYLRRLLERVENKVLRAPP